MARRTRVQMFCNQYIDGAPFLTETLELSMSGALVRRVLSPNLDRACYALELGLVDQPEDRVWLCASPVWRMGAFEAMRFVAQTPADRLRLAHLLGQVSRPRFGDFADN
ncbi:MAG: hypothetical protein U0271_48410 [Polyangiaceae bacterium]